MAAAADAAVVVTLRHELRQRPRRSRSVGVSPRSTADLVTLLNAGVISLREARRYLRLEPCEEVGPCG